MHNIILLDARTPLSFFSGALSAAISNLQDKSESRYSQGRESSSCGTSFYRAEEGGLSTQSEAKFVFFLQFLYTTTIYDDKKK